MGRPPLESESGNGPDDPSRSSLSRRSLLRTSAGIGLASGLAGCMGFDLSDVTTYRFSAAPVALGEPSRSPAYELENQWEHTIERTRSLMGTEIDVELTNHAALYSGDVDSLGLLSSPAAKVATEPLNPLATASFRDLLAGRASDRIIDALDMSELSTVTWTKGPKPVATGTGTLLGQETEITAIAGVTEQVGFVLLTVARVTADGDVVIAATAQQRDGNAPSLIGQDGYVERETVTESVDRLSALLPRVTRGGAGVHLVESAHVTSPGTNPNFVRTVVANQYSETTVYSGSLFAQFFDADGDLLDFETASVPSLDPGERFEGYLPYIGNAVAGYAIEAEETSRRIVSDSVNDIEVVSDRREGDTVTIEIRNTAGRTVPYIELLVTFYDDEGTALWTQQRTIANLTAGEGRKLDVVFASPSIAPSASIGDYAVEVVRYGGNIHYVR